MTKLFTLLTCLAFSLGQLSAQNPLYATYFQAGDPVAISTSSTAAGLTTFTFDDACETVRLSVTDPDNAPLSPSNPYTMTLRDAAGDRITDLTGNVNVTMRVRSSNEPVTLSVLFRSGGGTSGERSAVKMMDIPADTTQWTDVTFTYEAGDLVGFVPTDLRDFWFYLDRGAANFRGNEFYIDHIVVGGTPDAAKNSPCSLDGGGSGGGGQMALFVDQFTADTLASIDQGNAAGRRATFVIDQDCETLGISITDPTGDPLPPFNAFQVEPTDASGSRITDVTDKVSLSMRVRSAEAVNISALFRGGGGTTDERSDRKDIDIPGDLTQWTNFTLEWAAGDLAGFNPAEFRDVWFYLDRGTENFAGNEIYFDYIAVGGDADQDGNSSCELDGGGGGGMMALFVDQFTADTLASIDQGNAAGRRATFTVDQACETLGISVTDQTGDPLPPFNAFQVEPTDASGSRITDVTGKVSLSMRVRSAEAVNISALFRGGGGTPDERSDRKDIDIPGDLTQWTNFTLEWAAGDLAGFNPAEFRDVWFYLDRGTENFAGNEIYFDYIAVGGDADQDNNSSCELDGGGGGGDDVFYTENFTSDTISRSLSQTNAAGRRATFDLDQDCETLTVSITDPTNDPLPPFNAFQLQVRDTSGSRITDITGKVNVSFRVRSRDTVNISVLFRGGDGTADFRSNRLDFDVPGDTTEWTEMTLSWEVDDLAGFDPADLRDMWFYLDRGTENFRGNEIVFDYISIGGKPTEEVHSPCTLDTGGNAEAIYREYFQGDSITNISRTNAAGRRLNFDLNTECETVSLSVIDPNGDPLPPFNAVQVDPVDAEGNEITDITGRVTATMRVRSAAAINISILFRSGDGSMANRSARKAVDVPGGLDAWTEFTVEFGPDELEGFDPADLVDLWFYIDRGEENFAGNFLDIDHITIGGAPDTEQNSPCSLVSVPTSYSVQFDAAEDTGILGGGESAKLTLTTNDCEEVKIEVTDPAGAPHQALRPIVITPIGENGAAITNIEGQVEVFIRARSAEAFPISVLFRSGDGAVENRTATLSQTVQGDLSGWSNLTYTFDTDDIGGFDPEDLVDLWVYLDRDNANFPGNELYIDYIAIGMAPDTMNNSPCGLPDLMTGTREAVWATDLIVAPNPTAGDVFLSIPFDVLPGGTAKLTLLNALGQQLPIGQTRLTAGSTRLQIGHYPKGTYYLLLTDREGHRAVRKLLKQ